VVWDLSSTPKAEQKMSSDSFVQAATDLFWKGAWGFTFTCVLAYELIAANKLENVKLGGKKRVEKLKESKASELASEFELQVDLVGEESKSYATPHSSPVPTKHKLPKAQRRRRKMTDILNEIQADGKTLQPKKSAHALHPEVTVSSPAVPEAQEELSAVDSKTATRTASWSKPKAPKSPAADHLRQRKLSMMGYPNLSSDSNTTTTTTTPLPTQSTKKKKKRKRKKT
jgi:hypothetical protein